MNGKQDAEDWELMAMGTKKWMEILGDPYEQMKWMAEYVPGPDDADFMSKMAFFAKIKGADDQFATLYEAAFNNEDMGLGPMVEFQNWWMNNMWFPEDPMYPHTVFGIASCLDVSYVDTWADADHDTVKAAIMEMWEEGGEFAECMEKYDLDKDEDKDRYVDLGDYSQENVMKVMEEIRASFADIEFGEDQLRLMRFFDQTGEWDKMGVFDDDAEWDTRLGALATAVIWGEANPDVAIIREGMSFREDILDMMLNAQAWADFYENNMNWFMATNPQFTVEDMMTWGTEKWMSILGEPSQMWQWMQDNLPSPDAPDFNDFAEIVTFFAAGQEGFVELYQAAWNFEQTKDLEALNNLSNFYNDFIQNEDKPQMPQVVMGIAKCLDIDMVRGWAAAGADAATVEAAIAGMFMDVTGDFAQCFAAGQFDMSKQ
jgi:hypothetical protein